MPLLRAVHAAVERLVECRNQIVVATAHTLLKQRGMPAIY
jgi:hypothetical protein